MQEPALHPAGVGGAIAVVASGALPLGRLVSRARRWARSRKAWRPPRRRPRHEGSRRRDGGAVLSAG
jgi:hypothetical protein